MTMNNQEQEFECVFECTGCGSYPTEQIIEDEGRPVSYCEYCEIDIVFECLLVYKSRGGHDTCIGTYPMGEKNEV